MIRTTDTREYRRAYSIFRGIMPEDAAHRQARVYAVMGYTIEDSSWVRDAERVKYVIPRRWDVAVEEYQYNMEARTIIEMLASEVHARPGYYLWNHLGEYVSIESARLGFSEGR